MYQRIRDLREDADLSQRQLAEILHMHKTTYARYESGEREIPLNHCHSAGEILPGVAGLSGGAEITSSFTVRRAAFSPGFFPPCALTATVLQ